MPFRGDVRAVPVPGCVDGWVALHERFGRLPLPTCSPRHRLRRRRGFPASTLLAAALVLVEHVTRADDLPEPGGAAPAPG
jgi:gamma-glutamyltranspeptidase / glutathione hydrolase